MWQDTWEPPEQTPQEREEEELWLEETHGRLKENTRESQEPAWGRPVATLYEMQSMQDKSLLMPRPDGPRPEHANDATVVCWNTVLADNPCETWEKP